jgi:hypothetical protein
LLLAAAACGGDRTGNAPLPALPAHSQSTPVKGRGQTLYVTNILTDAGQLLGYSVSTLAVTYSTSTGLNEPNGMAVDKTGAVYVANTYGYNILKFKPPATKPAQTIDDRKYRPTDVALDSKGDIWVANWCTRSKCAPGNIAEYNSTGELLQRIKCPNLMFYTYLAIDRHDNIVIDGGGTSYSDAAEIAAGSTECTELPAIHVASAGGVAFLKNGDVTVIDQLDNVMRTYAQPTFSELVATTSFYGVQYLSDTAFESGDRTFFASSEGATAVFEFAYPAGGSPIRTIPNIDFPAGVAIGPTRK